MPDKRGLKAALGMSEVARGGDLGKCLLAEAIGVFFINYFGCMSCINVGSHDPKSLVLIALTFGFVVMIAVQ
ncbi:Aquaporin 1-like, partial [Halyomorpha halys]